MNKLDEIKEAISRIYMTETDVLPKYHDVLEQLRPYIELAEWVKDHAIHIKLLIIRSSAPGIDELRTEFDTLLKQMTVDK